MQESSPSTNSCGSCSHDHSHDHNSENFNWRRERNLTTLVFVLLLIGLGFHDLLHQTPGAIAEYGVMIPAYLISGWSVLTSAGRNIFRGQIFDENFLMSIATLGAIAIHQIPEAVAVMLFFKIGEIFQGLAVGNSRRSIQALLEAQPNTANLKVNGTVQPVDPETVAVGDLILVRPGEKVPLDGEIVEGSSRVDASALTGESISRAVDLGNVVLAGMINQSGLLTLRVTQPLADSSLAKILDLVENASRKKGATEKFITRFARYYTPVVVGLAAAIATLPPLFLPGATPGEWIYRALVLLVISCPCGLVISIPLGYFGGIGRAAKRGILVKGATFLDALTQVKTVVFDKTGTLTQGNFKVTEVMPSEGITPAITSLRLLELAAQAEAHSNHPIAQSIRAAYKQPIDESVTVDYQEIPGYGVQARLRGQILRAGNDQLLHQHGVPHDDCIFTGTVVHLALDQQYLGHLKIADELKSDAKQAIQLLQQAGIATVMLTGDSRIVAEQVAHQLGLDYYRAELLPEDKVSILEEILLDANRLKQKVAFVGDGFNDAPAIARADVGIAMGGLGSDAAIETADVVIMTDAPAKVAEAVQIAQKTLRVVWQNVILAMVIKGIFIGLGVMGVATLWEAVFADVGVAFLAILNAGRVIR